MLYYFDWVFISISNIITCWLEIFLSYENVESTDGRHIWSGTKSQSINGK